MCKQIWQQEPPEETQAYFFTNRKLSSIHSESVPRSRSTATVYSCAENKKKYREVESVEQDLTARMCRLILLYTLRRINSWSRPVA